MKFFDHVVRTRGKLKKRRLNHPSNGQFQVEPFEPVMTVGIDDEELMYISDLESSDKETSTSTYFLGLPSDGEEDCEENDENVNSSNTIPTKEDEEQDCEEQDESLSFELPTKEQSVNIGDEELMCMQQTESIDDEELMYISDSDKETSTSLFFLDLPSDDEEDCEEHDENVDEEEDCEEQDESLSFELPTKEELDKEKYDLQNPTDRAKLYRRIERIAMLLFKCKEELSREEDYVDQLVSDMSIYYECKDKFYVEEILKMFDAGGEALEFFNYPVWQFPRCVFVNTLKIRREELEDVFKAGEVKYDLLKWCDVGLVVHGPKTYHFTNTAEYEAGLYTIEPPCYFLPVMALDPQKDETIAEMSASVGGRTIQVAARMQNTGTIFANVLKKHTIAFKENLMRTGVKNTKVYTKNLQRKAAFLGKDMVDKVLLIAPCSNTVTQMKGKSKQKKCTKEDIQVCRRPKATIAWSNRYG